MDNNTVEKILSESGLKNENVSVYRATEGEFRVYGLMPPDAKDPKYHRLPEEIAASTNEGVHLLYADTAGGRLRFATDSDYIGIYAVAGNVSKMSHFALTGSTGFDLYREESGRQLYQFTVVPPFGLENGDAFSGAKCYDRGEFFEYTLNFPLYCQISDVYIVLNKNARVAKPREYSKTTPIVYYGSSITQGGCASRPGNSYQAMLSRRFDCDYINLGFSGSARGEDVIADYIASLDMSVFVYDYDHNAPNAEHLRNTHKKMFDTVRKAHPSVPIVCMSSPTPLADGEERRSVIKATVEAARSTGDENVYYINGCDCSTASNAGDSVSVDGCHPNDLGFYFMAQLLGDALEEIFAK